MPLLVCLVNLDVRVVKEIEEEWYVSKFGCGTLKLVYEGGRGELVIDGKVE